MSIVVSLQQQCLPASPPARLVVTEVASALGYNLLKLTQALQCAASSSPPDAVKFCSSTLVMLCDWTCNSVASQRLPKGSCQKPLLL